MRYDWPLLTWQVRANITKKEGSDKDIELAHDVEVDPFEALKLQEQDHDVGWSSITKPKSDLLDQIPNT